MAKGCRGGDVAPISTDNEVIEVVSDFKYLGTLVSSSGSGLHYSLEGIIMKRSLRWLGQVVRMSKEKSPKQLLFGWLPKTRPTHSP